MTSLAPHPVQGYSSSQQLVCEGDGTRWVDLKVQADSCSGASMGRHHSANTLRLRYHFQESDKTNYNVQIRQVKEDP